MCAPSNTHPAAPPLAKAATADTALDRTLAGFDLTFSLPASFSSFCSLAISSVVVPDHGRQHVLRNRSSGKLNVPDRQKAQPGTTVEPHHRRTQGHSAGPKNRGYTKSRGYHTPASSGSRKGTPCSEADRGRPNSTARSTYFLKAQPLGRR